MNDKLAELLRATLAKTDARTLTWDAFNEESVRARIGSGSLHIQRETETDAQVVGYAVQVADRFGQFVMDIEVANHDAGFKLCDDLFRSARKNTTSDRVLDEMLDALGGTKRAS
jgi:hypothetical protein